jgi:hypothetical protein
MFSEVEHKSTVERVDNHGQDNNSLFLAAMADSKAVPEVTRVATTMAPGIPLPPILENQGSFQSTYTPATGNLPYFEIAGAASNPNRVAPSASERYAISGLNPASPGAVAPIADYYPNTQTGPGSGNNWKSSWGDNPVGSQFNPAPPPVDSGKPWRAGYGDVAPGFPRNPAEPPADSYKPWKNNWGDVSPVKNSPWATDSNPGNYQPPSPPDGQAGRTSYNPAPEASRTRPSPWDLPSAPAAPAPPPVVTGEAGGYRRPGDFVPSVPPAANPSDRNSGGMKNPGDFFPGYPSDNTGGRGDSGAGKTGGSNSRDEAVNAFNQDQVTRTEGSFNNAVSRCKALARENEVALELIMHDWLAQQSSRHPLTFMRGTANLADALGQFRLEEGSRIDLTHHQDTKPRILKGYDYDFGGEATTFLRLSAGSLVEAQQYVQGHKDLVIEGQPMNDTYLQQLRNLQTDVESKLNVIYGPHDVGSVFNMLRNEVRVHAGDWQQGLVRLQHQLDALRTTDHRFVAKSARDVALGYLAEADYMASQNNGEDAKIMYRDANKYLGLALSRDPNAPDNQAIQTIAASLRDKINGAIDNQWKDPFGNPFEIPKPQNAYV